MLIKAIWILPLLSGLIAFFFTPLTIRFAKKFKLLTDAGSKSHPAHTHIGVLPRAGGLPIFLGVFLPLIFFMITNQILFFVFLGASLILVVGLLDDKYNLSPYLRFGANIISASVAVLGGIGIPFITSPIAGIIRLDQFQITVSFLNNHYHFLWLADLIAILWIVWCMNMINWSKGVDGQLPGFVFIAAIYLGLLSLRFTHHNISRELVLLLAFCTGFSYLGFLPWNFYPQKILPGYSAGSLAGYLLSITAILAWGKFSTLILLLILPFTDAVLVFFRRILNRKSPFEADRGHFHHALLDLGWSRRKIAIFYWLVSLITGILALTLPSGSVGIVSVFLCLFLATIIIIVSKQSKKAQVSQK